MSLLPLFLKLEGRTGLLVGAGSVALEKVESLLPTGVRLRVVAPRIHDAFRTLAAAGRVELIEREFVESDLNSAFIAIAATDQPEVNAAVYHAAVARGILANSVDDPPNCDFYFGSLVRRGELQIAISTAGASPAVAQNLRREIDAQLPADLGPWLEEFGALRREVLATHPRGEHRKALLHNLAQRQLCASPHCSTRLLAQAQPLAKGTVYLVGAGPGDPELLTVKALRVLGNAQVILHDDLVPAAILALASKTAEIVNVGKRCGTKSITQEQIDALMIAHAHQGHSVVRLKSGDPMLYGRAAEEIHALETASVAYEIVPGVSSGFAAAAAVGASLTSRSTASQIVFSTGHHAPSRDHKSTSHAQAATRVIYMPGRDLRALATQLLAEGLAPELPCAVISRATQPDEHIQCATLAGLAAVRPAEAPSLVLAGWALWESSRVRQEIEGHATAAVASATCTH